MQPKCGASAASAAQKDQPRKAAGSGNQWQKLEAAEVARGVGQKLWQPVGALDESCGALGPGAFGGGGDPVGEGSILAHGPFAARIGGRRAGSAVEIGRVG